MLDRFQFRKPLRFSETLPSGASYTIVAGYRPPQSGGLMSLRLFTPRSNPSKVARTGYRNSVSLFLAATALSTFTGRAAFAVDGDANDILLKKMEKMEQRIQSLEAELKQKQVVKHEEPAKPARTSALQATAKAPNKDPIKDIDKDTGKGGNKDAGKEPNAATSPADATDLRTKSTAKALPTPASSPDLPILGLAASPVAGLSIAAYGEIKYGAMQNPAANGQWQNGFDAARFVLLPTYAITDNIIFNAEIEFEHAGSGFDADDKLHGTAEIEQIWIDFKIMDQFNWRSPAVDFVPIGHINQHHEPTQCYSVNRPELYNGLIPSTFFAGASSVDATIADGRSYQVQVSSSIEDFGGDFGLPTDAKTVPPFPAGYTAGISGLDALAFSRPVRGDFQQLNNTLAYAGRLDFSPAFLPGFAASVSGYCSPNGAPRGAYAEPGGFLRH